MQNIESPITTKDEKPPAIMKEDPNFMMMLGRIEDALKLVAWSNIAKTEEERNTIKARLLEKSGN